ncbi:MAG: phage holin family protein [Bacteroidetes bacterium]|nr:phage holin family protein [Bacteroidota bacterium]
MKSTENILEQAGESLEYVKQYVSNQQKLLKLEIAERSARMMSGMVLGLSLALIGLMSLGFVSVALAFWLTQITGSAITGFLIVGGFYLVLAIVLYVFRKPIIVNPVLSRVIQNFFD